MERLRHRYQGVGNIVRFNWHFYVLAGFAIVGALWSRQYQHASVRNMLDLAVILVCVSIAFSLIVSWYIYDVSGLYTFAWLDDLTQAQPQSMVNIHAGFDETSALLKAKFRTSELFVFDFYDPAKHTEVSIKRARNAYSTFPGTQQIATDFLPLPDSSTDKVFIMLSAHEIRNEQERVAFFKEIKRVLAPSGQVVITEHQRDLPNFLAYNIGFFHFYSRATWLKTFEASGLSVANQIKITPFITTFVLQKNGTAN